MKRLVPTAFLLVISTFVESAEQQPWVAIAETNSREVDQKPVEWGSVVEEPGSSGMDTLAFGNTKNPHTIQMDKPDESYTGYAQDGRPVGHYIYSYKPEGEQDVKKEEKVQDKVVGKPFDWASFIAAQKSSSEKQTLTFGDPKNPHVVHMDPPEEAYYGYAPDGRPVGHFIYSYPTKKNETESEEEKPPIKPEKKPYYPPKMEMPTMVMKEEDFKDPYAKQGSFIDGVAIFIFPMIIIISLGLYVPFIESLSLPTKRSLSGKPVNAISAITEVVLAGMENPQCFMKLKCIYEARVKAKSWGNNLFTFLEIVAPAEWISRWARKTRASKNLSEDYCETRFQSCKRL